MVALDLEVIEPGVLRAQGFWTHPVLVVTADNFCVCKEHLQRPVSLEGRGPLVFTGPVSSAIFMFG